MKLPERLVDRIVSRIVDELSSERLIEAEDPESFKRKIKNIFREAQEQERLLDQKAKELLRDKLNLIEENDIDYRTAFRTVKARLAEEMNINLNRRERMNQIANMIRDLIMKDDSVEIYEDPPIIRRRIAKILRDAVREEEEIDKTVRQRIRKLSKNILEGTKEWEIYYQKFYNEELIKKGLA